MPNASLFQSFQSPEPTLVDVSTGPFAGVALEKSIDRVLDYSIPPRFESMLQIGQQVRVPLGKSDRPTRGYVVSIHPTTDHPKTKIKSLLTIEDDRVLVPPRSMELARWMSRYYASPLGTVLESIIPSAVKRRIGMGYTNIVRLAKDSAEIQAVLEKTKAPKRRSVLARLLLLEKDRGIDLIRLAGEAGVTTATVRKLVGLGYITIRSEVDLPRLTENMPMGAADEQPIALNDDQRQVFENIKPRIKHGGFSVNLLHGVTGSGKTEIYLQCVADIIAQGKQALLLVPEIALTWQTVRRFTARFARVAILHSGLTATQRHRYWHQVSLGHADVVVGARSAIFAPLPNLGIIVVDEEHDSSYKQDQSPRYHARDIAIKRGQIEKAPVILGSATPSLEMYFRCRAGGSSPPRRGEPGVEQSSAVAPSSGEKVVDLTAPPPRLGSSIASAYYYLSLPRRVRGLAMPDVELVDMGQERRLRRGVHLISLRLEHLLKSTIEAGRQAIILLNRRGYANFIYCSSCTNAVQCKYCDATMTYHRSADARAEGGSLAAGLHTGQMHCHYCLAVNKLPEQCPTCGKKLSLFGLGTQRVEEELKHLFPALRFARVDSDVMRNSRDYEAALSKFASGELQVMLGTQMIAKGLDYPNVTLVGVISGDTALALPDFRAAERTFQLITQVAGRAGRGDSAGRVVLQTFLPDDPTIQAALRQDYPGFAAMELANRQEVQLPPYSRLARIILRHQDQPKLHDISQKLAEQLAVAIAQLDGNPSPAVIGTAQSGGLPAAAITEAGVPRASLESASTSPHSLFALDTPTFSASNLSASVRMRGPMPCPIGRIAGYFRNQIVMTASRPEPIQKVLAQVRAGGGFAKVDIVAVDVDPVSLL